MVHGELVIAGLLMAVAGLSALARYLSVPYPIVLVVGGALLGFVPGLPSAHLDPEVLAPMGLRLSTEKTKITHIDEGLDFLGWRIQRHRKRGTDRSYVYTYPSRKAIKAVTIKVKTICRRTVNQPLQTLIRQLNPALRGWCAYFKPGVSAATFADLARYTLDRIMRWARRKHRRITVKSIRRRYCNGRWWPTTPEIELFNPDTIRTTRYRYRGTAIPSPWPTTG